MTGHLNRLLGDRSCDHNLSLPVQTEIHSPPHSFHGSFTGITGYHRWLDVDRTVQRTQDLERLFLLTTLQLLHATDLFQRDRSHQLAVVVLKHLNRSSHHRSGLGKIDPLERLQDDLRADPVVVPHTDGYDWLHNR